MKDRTVAVGTATVKMAAAAPDKTVYSMEMAKATTEATEAAADESACRRGTGARGNSQASEGRRAAGKPGRHHADRRDRARNTCANHRSSVVLVMMVARGACSRGALSSPRCCRGVAVPVDGHTGGKARCRVRWCAEAEGIRRRASGAGGAQMAGGWHLWHLSRMD